MERDHSIQKIRWIVTGQSGLKFFAIVAPEDFLSPEGSNPYHPSLNDIAFGYANIGGTATVEFDNIFFGIVLGVLATGQTIPFLANKNDEISGTVPIPDDGALEGGTRLQCRDNGDGVNYRSQYRAHVEEEVLLL